MDISKILQLKPKEEVLEVVHEHVFPYMPKIIVVAIWFLFPFFFLFPLFRAGWFGILFFVLLVGSAVFVGFRSYLKWNYTMLIITDRRIVDVEQKGLFDRVFSEVTFNQIDEVTYRVKGFFPTLLSYGVFIVKTRGNAADIEFNRISGCARLHDVLNDLRQTILDEEREHKKAQIEELTEKLSMDEVKEMARSVRHKEQANAVEDFYQNNEE